MATPVIVPQSLVGRIDVARALQQTVTEVETGQPRVVLITGEPGIGKTLAALGRPDRMAGTEAKAEAPRSPVERSTA